MTTDYILQQQEDLRKLKKLERQAEKLKAAWNAKEESAPKTRLEAKLARMRGEKAPEPKQEAKPAPKPIAEAALSLASKQPEKNTVAKKKPASKRKPIVRSKK